MKWIGLTGGIATGKSTVAKILRDFGLPVVDADQLARDAVMPRTKGLEAVVASFGREILLPNGELDRAKLGKLIFADSAKREKLESILHPIIQELRAVERLRLEREGAAVAFYDVPLLFEKNLESEFDSTILVYAPLESQLKRIGERDNVSGDEARARLASQLPIDEKLKLANFIIFNRGSIAELKMNVLAVLRELGVKL